MSLIVALKNRNSVVVATDSDSLAQSNASFGQLMTVSGHAVILIAGNLDAVRPAITQILPKLDQTSAPATVAQLVHASLILGVVPRLDQLKGRTEIIVAGLDPIRHIQEPVLYYMDSAQGFHLQMPSSDAIAAGSTAAVASLLAGHSFAASTTAQLKVLAKECLSATKLRWPGAVSRYIKLAVLTPDSIQVADF
jgi:20S proteasome alpha/beta subunit